MMDFSEETMKTVQAAHKMGYDCATRACYDIAKKYRSKAVMREILARNSKVRAEVEEDEKATRR